MSEIERDEVGALKLDEIESKALAALARQAREGNASAAAACLTAVERCRKTRLGLTHAEALKRLASDPIGLVSYLSSLGLSALEVSARVGHKLSKAEQAAWAKAQDDRLLEVRAVELGRMRRGDGDVPKWATRRHDV